MDSKFKRMIAVLRQKHDDFSSEIDRLEEGLTDLRYEGKINFNRNAENLRATLNSLQKGLSPHIKVEDVCFKFIGMHIPKVYAMANVLEAEHKELLRCLKYLDALARRLTQAREGAEQRKAVDQLKEKGMYFAYLFRQHVQIEDDGIFRLAEKEFHLREKKGMLTEMMQCKGWKEIEALL